jgi:PAS domain-containing protein
MSQAFPDEAVLWFDDAGRHVDANDGALRLLGVTREEWLTSPPERFAIEPTEAGGLAILRSHWEAEGAQTLFGTAGLKLPDGSTIRVSYAIDRMVGGYRARLSPIDRPPPHPTTIVTVRDVLRDWRAAERRLGEHVPGTPAWVQIQDEIEMLRLRYQEVFRSVTGTDLPNAPA